MSSANRHRQHPPAQRNKQEATSHKDFPRPTARYRRALSLNRLYRGFVGRTFYP